MPRQPPRVLITGSPGSGKSTLVKSLIQDLDGARIVGLSTPEIRRGDARKGFKMINLASGEERQLASVSGDGPMVGKYHVSVPGIDEIVEKIESSLDTADYVFIDEIGKMELYSKKFEAFVDHVFSLNKPLAAVVHRSLVTRSRNKGRVFVMHRDDFDPLRQAVLSAFELKKDKEE